MFIEPDIREGTRGWIEVICGSMFSGKTEELIRRLKRARIANLKVEIYKAHLDNRYHHFNIVSHDESSIASVPVENAEDILKFSDDADVIGIDEAQFFGPEIVNVAEQLAMKGIRVIIAGLDMDYTGKPFGPMPSLLSVADYITKLHAICMQCGSIAGFSYRITAVENQLLVGEKDHYEARCRKCFFKSGDGSH